MYNNLDVTIIKYVTREVRNFIGIFLLLILNESWTQNIWQSIKFQVLMLAFSELLYLNVPQYSLKM